MGSFVVRHRPQLDIESVATGETWFGEDAIERKLADSLQTFDDVLLELYRNDVEIYTVAFKQPKEGPLAMLGGGASALALPLSANKPQPRWIARVLSAAFGLP